MKIFRRILLIILCIAIAVLAIGFLLPENIHVERRLLMSGSQRTIYSQVNTLKNWKKWSPWLLTDTAVKVRFSGPESGVGASFAWMSKDIDVGSGTVLIVSSVYPDSLVVVYDFVEKGRSTEKYCFLKENLSTDVIVSFDSDLGMNPISRWIGLFSDQLIGPDLDKGLNKLDQLVQDTVGVYGFQIVDTQVPAKILISIRDTTGPTNLTPKITELYKRLSLFLKSRSLSPVGNPVTIFHTYSNRSFDIEVGLPVPTLNAVPDGFTCAEIAAQRVVMIKFLGPYKKIPSAYLALQNYIVNNELEIINPGWEEYITNPNMETDSNKLQTNIFYPVK